MNFHLQNTNVLLDDWLWAISHVCSWYGHSCLIPSPRQDKSLREFQISSVCLMNSQIRHNYQQYQSINK